MLFQDRTIEQFIDILEGNRKYVRCLYVQQDRHDVDRGGQRICAMPDCMVLSPRLKLNLDIFKDMLWEYLGLVRVYTKPRGKKPDFGDPLVLTDGRHGTSIEAACKQIHRSLLMSFDYAMVWGTSVKHTPQRGFEPRAARRDVIQIIKKRGNDIKLDPSNQMATWRTHKSGPDAQGQGQAEVVRGRSGATRWAALCNGQLNDTRKACPRYTVVPLPRESRT